MVITVITICNKVAKVMFLHVSVVLFTGGAIPACIAGGIPACLAVGGVLSQYALQEGGRGSAPRGGVCSKGACSGRMCLLWGVCSWEGGCLLGGGCGDPPQKQMATVADSTHPTGMHSCLLMWTGKLR